MQSLLVNIHQDLIKGLSKLEYRGYDSAGLSLITNSNRIKRIRCTGKVNALNKLLTSSKLKGNCRNCSYQMGYSRYTKSKNSHPHNYGGFSIVHNGIIENSDEIKNFLSKKSHKFSSDTDSEVIAHLLEYYSNKTNKLSAILLKTFKKLKGSFALGIMYEDQPDKIIVASNGSPLLIGIGKNANYISSDIHAFASKTKKYISLEDNEFAISKNSFELFNVSGKKVNRKPSVTKQNTNTISKNGFKITCKKKSLSRKISSLGLSKINLEHLKYSQIFLVPNLI